MSRKETFIEYLPLHQLIEALGGAAAYEANPEVYKTKLKMGLGVLFPPDDALHVSMLKLIDRPYKSVVSPKDRAPPLGDRVVPLLMWLRAHKRMGGSATFEAYAKANPQGHLHTSSTTSKASHVNSISLDATQTTVALYRSETGGGMTYFWCYANYDSGDWKYYLVGWIYGDSAEPQDAVDCTLHYADDQRFRRTDCIAFTWP
ncbi:hypothetical protein K438DRAFT_1979864 [Mycena galopus ATCC 62051]|nr:hypothetical protein K438DRAFT_1979864 [Mycena galopus ATCC 62051]